MMTTNLRDLGTVSLQREDFEKFPQLCEYPPGSLVHLYADPTDGTLWVVPLEFSTEKEMEEVERWEYAA